MEDGLKGFIKDLHGSGGGGGPEKLSYPLLLLPILCRSVHLIVNDRLNGHFTQGKVTWGHMINNFKNGVERYQFSTVER